MIRNYLGWSDEGRPAIWRYLAAIVLRFVFWMWGSIPAILLLQEVLQEPATKSVAFEYTFVVGLVAILLITRYLTEGDVLQAVTPFIVETPTIERAACFAVGQAVLTIVAAEWIVRRRALRASSLWTP